jgi:Domain of unknown function (DUF4157)
MRSLATKQPSNQDFAHQKPVRAAPMPIVRSRSLSSVSTGSTVLQRKSICACGGGCPRCQEQALLQTKLKISEPGDKYEQEADRVADQVMQMPEPSVQPQVEPEEEEEEMVQREAIVQQDTSEAPPIVNEVVRSPGQSLNSDIRIWMESRFGHDFSQVRVHADANAAESAQTVNALAYTVGQDIVFGTGQYQPQGKEGKKLLAHELTHVLQQKNSLSTKVASSNTTAEAEADQNAQHVAANGDISVQTKVNAGMMQRQPAKKEDPKALDPQAEKIMQIAQNEKRDLKIRAVEIVYRILSHFYPSESSKVGAVGYDDSRAKGGLETESYLQPNTKIYYGHIWVGQKFVKRVANKHDFAHAVLQVGHELEHIDQYRSGMVGKDKQPEREFLAFYHEALATEKPGSGRLQHSTRASIIDAAIGYYYCLSSSLQQQYTNKLNELLQRRPQEIKFGYERKMPPTSCEKQK